jgi:hypothetical protein
VYGRLYLHAHGYMVTYWFPGAVMILYVEKIGRERICQSIISIVNNKEFFPYSRNRTSKWLNQSSKGVPSRLI